MPELPEVETVVRQIRTKIKDKKILRVEIKDKKRVNFMRLSGKVLDLYRRGKGIILKLDKGRNVLMHLKMSGRLLWRGPIEKSTKLVFYNNNKDYFVFNDVRRFGYAKLVSDQELSQEKFLNNLGPEPLNKNFTLSEFTALINRKPKAKIKVILNDQTWLAGVGNIYSQEICYCAGVLPQRALGSLQPEEIKRLYQCLKRILTAAIKHRGSSVDEGYVDGLGVKGHYDKLLKIYSRKKKLCLRCKTPVIDVKLGGRGTRYCPKCQK